MEQKQPYEPPKVYELGTVEGLTQSGDNMIDKCGGSADVEFPQLLSPDYSYDCP